MKLLPVESFTADPLSAEDESKIIPEIIGSSGYAKLYHYKSEFLTKFFMFSGMKESMILTSVEEAPADCPHIVILEGSPPKFAIFCRIHSIPSL